MSGVLLRQGRMTDVPAYVNMRAVGWRVLADREVATVPADRRIWMRGRWHALAHVQEAHNLAVTAGRNLIRDFLNGDAVTGLTHFALGTDGTAVTAADTALGAEVFRDVFTQTTKDAAKLTVKYYLDSSSANGNTLREAALLNAASGGTMYARVALPDAIVKTTSLAYTFTWDLTWGV